ncbi:MAG: heme NO-binding domain-containing protein [Candidatus Kapaibacteriota bacterium]|jgi:hypothetical protein
MHGIIHFELRKFVESRYGGSDTWDFLLKKAGLADNLYFPNQNYPDSELVAILVAASEATGKSIDALQREFGEFMVPDMAQTYKAYIKKEWKLLDFLENIEETIHGTVRRNNPGAAPPSLKITRINPKEVMIEYTSERKMYGVLHGILQGVINLYQEKVAVKVVAQSPVYQVNVALVS